MPHKASTLLSALVVLAAGFILSISQEAKALDREVLWKCAAGYGCPKGLTPNRAETGLSEIDKRAVAEERKRQKERAKYKEREIVACAQNNQCPDGLSQNRANEISNRQGATPDKLFEGAKRCYASGVCPENMTREDALLVVNKFEEEILKREREQYEKRSGKDNSLTPQEWPLIKQRCEQGVDCPYGVTPEIAKNFDNLDKLDQAIYKCAAGFACPEGLTKSQAKSLIGSDYERWREEQKKKLEKASAEEPEAPDVPPQKAENVDPENEGAEPGNNESPVSPKPRPEPQPKPEPEPESDGGSTRQDTAEAPASVFEDPEVAEQIERAKKEIEKNLKPLSEPKNPNVALAASVVAESPRQSTPRFFGENELLTPRLPSIAGDGVIDIPGFDAGDDEDDSLAEQDPDIEKLGDPRPMQGVTFESVAYPNRAPKSFRLERSNNETTSRGSSQVFSSVWGQISHEGVRGVQMKAEIAAKHTKEERRDAKRITNPVDAAFDTLIYIPIDDGGPAFELDTFVHLELPDEGINVSIVPYTEDSIKNVFLPQQIFTAVSANGDQRSLSSTQALYSLAGMRAPAVGGVSITFVDFSFPETERGKPRGLIVSLSGHVEMQETRRVDTIRGFDPVTIITEEAKQTATVLVKLAKIRQL